VNHQERRIIGAILLLVAVLVSIDIYNDSKEGVVLWHVLVEGLIGALALAGVFYLMSGSVKLKHRLNQEIADFSAFKKEAEAWRADSRKYIDGLSLAIDEQLSKWKLSTAEKEVAFLLLKGLSLKEVAEVRETTEKTARVQSMAIYSKAGISGRSELAAFFLEDLLLPSPKSDESVAQK
jgi:DNA-binding CsgD family transcriptional regulator